MIESKAFQITSDTHTTCQCGHSIKPGEEYLMLRTSIPKWISVCLPCFNQLLNPEFTTLPQLAERYFNSKDPEIVKKTIDKKQPDYRIKERKEKLKIIAEVEWI